MECPSVEMNYLDQEIGSGKYGNYRINGFIDVCAVQSFADRSWQRSQFEVRELVD